MNTFHTRSVAVPEHLAWIEREVRSREKHLDVLSICWIVIGAFYALYGLALSGLLIASLLSQPPQDPAGSIVITVFAVTVLLVCLATTVLYCITAWGLHRRRNWARVTSYVLASLLIMTLCLAPLGAYALWVLIGDVTDMAFGRFPPPRPAVQRQAPLQIDWQPGGAPFVQYVHSPPQILVPVAAQAPSGVHHTPPVQAPAPAARPSGAIPEAPPTHLSSMATIREMPAIDTGDEEDPKD